MKRTTKRTTAVYRQGATAWGLTITDPDVGAIVIDFGSISYEDRRAVRREAGRIFGTPRKKGNP